MMFPAPSRSRVIADPRGRCSAPTARPRNARAFRANTPLFRGLAAKEKSHSREEPRERPKQPRERPKREQAAAQDHQLAANDANHVPFAIAHQNQTSAIFGSLSARLVNIERLRTVLLTVCRRGCLGEPSSHAGSKGVSTRIAAPNSSRASAARRCTSLPCVDLTRLRCGLATRCAGASAPSLGPTAVRR